MSRARYLREQFRQSVRLLLLQQGVSLPIEGELSLTLTVEEHDDYRLDLDNLLTGVMSSLDDKPFMPGPRVLRDDRQIKTVHIVQT